MIFQPILSNKVLITKNITANGTYTAAGDSADGYNTILVGVKTGVLTPIAYDMTNGYVSSGTFTYENLTVCRMDVYEVQAGHTYLIMMGDVVGTRFRVMWSSESTVGCTTSITGVQVVNKNNPPQYDFKTYTVTDDGYFTVQKDNQSHTGLKSYVLDLEYIVRDCNASPI